MKRKDKKTARAFALNESSGAFGHNGLMVLLLGVVLLVTYIVYSRSVHYPFVNYDDFELIVENPNIRNLNAETLGMLFTKGYNTDYRPVSHLVQALIFSKAGLNPAAFRSANIFLHLCNTVLVFLFVSLLLRNRYFALFASMVHALHPMHTESVVWISAFNDTLYVFFFLLSLIAYVKFRNSKQSMYYVAALIMFVLSALSKPMAVSLPLVLPAIDIVFYNKKWKELTAVLPFLAIAFALVWISTVVRIDDVSLMNNRYPLWDRLFFATYSTVSYVVKFFAPFNQSVLYPYPKAGTYAYLGLFFYFSFIVVLGFIAVLTMKRKSLSAITLFGLYFFAVNILPVVQIIPFANKTLIAERYTYLSYLGLCIALTGLKGIRNKLQISVSAYGSYKIILFLLIAFVSAFASAGRLPVWKDSLSLWTDVVRKNPGAHVAFNNRANVKYEMGDTTGALADLNKAIGANKNFALAYYNRALIHSETGASERAIQDFSKAVEINDNFIAAFFNRGNEYVSTGAMDKALDDYNKVIEKDPQTRDAYFNRGIVNMNMENYAQAVKDFEMTTNLDNTYADAYFNKGICLINLGCTIQACNSLKQAQRCGHVQVKDYLEHFCVTGTTQ